MARLGDNVVFQENARSKVNVRHKRLDESSRGSHEWLRHKREWPRHKRGADSHVYRWSGRAMVTPSRVTAKSAARGPRADQGVRPTHNTATFIPIGGPNGATETKLRVIFRTAGSEDPAQAKGHPTATGTRV